MTAVCGLRAPFMKLRKHIRSEVGPPVAFLMSAQKEIGIWVITGI